MKIKSLFLAVFLFFVLNYDAQEWPKLMKLFDGKIMDIRYRGDSGFFCMDYTGKRIPCLDMNHSDRNAAKFLYVDSTGKPISSERFDYAESFMGGVAAVWGPKTTPQTYAIINAKAEYISPFSTDNKFAIGHGLFVIDKKTTKEVYNREGKLVTECSDCWVRVFEGMKNVIIAPDRKAEGSMIRMLTPDGRELFRRRGQGIEALYNSISGGSHLNPQPYYILQVDGAKNQNTVISDDGKLVLDSVESFSFYVGKAVIKKNKLASVIDTNFQTLIPFSYGYDFYMEYEKHPQGAYGARKNGKYMVIDPKSGKQLIPVTSTVTYITYRRDFNMYELRAPDMWFMSLAGDTIVSPYKYEVSMPLYPDAPGFLVTRKNGNRMGYLSEEGKLLIPCEYDQLAYGGKNMFLFFKDTKAGYLDLNGKLKFYVEGAIKLSSFFQGYALCSVKMTDIKGYSESAQSVSSSQGSYQVQNKLIDSTGKFVSQESFDWLFLMKDGYAHVIKNRNTFMVDKHLKKVLIDGNCQMMSYFYKGYALIYNPEKKTWGLVNEKLDVVVPAIYDKLETKEDERRYGYRLFSKNGDDRSPGFSNYYANVKVGKLKVVLQGKEEIIPVRVPEPR